MHTNTCHCIIRHAITTEERAEAAENLSYSRSIGDRHGIMLSLWMLQPCPSAAQSDADTDADGGK